MKRFSVWAPKALAACIILGLVVAHFVLDRPLSFAFDQAANHFYRKGDGLPQQITGWLIETGIARDWAEPEDALGQEAPYPLLLSAASSTNSFQYQTYTSAGQPDGMQQGAFLPPVATSTINVSNVKEIMAAIRNAQAGDIITIAPGSYDFKGHAISVQAAGSANLPIYLRAERFGTVLINLDMLEGFYVTAPYWVFENLRIQGTCSHHGNCEHAFHVVGNGKSFTLRNSEVFNFNAPVKVNMYPIGGVDQYADKGLLEYSSFYNQTPRNTGNPVTLLNIDAADGWVVRGNYIADFVKNGGDYVSYAGFMKGNGRDGIFERNLVMCEHRLAANEGIRVGLSFGGGGTGARFCKQQNCAVEFSGGVMRNNIIMNCSRDVGIYLNKAAQTKIYHNLLYNNLGMDVRFETSSASIDNNIISGRIRDRDQGRSQQKNNIIVRDCLGSSAKSCELYEIYQSPDQADFRLKSLETPIWEPLEPSPGLTEDFCGEPLPAEANIGPIQYSNGVDCLATPGSTEGNETNW